VDGAAIELLSSFEGRAGMKKWVVRGLILLLVLAGLVIWGLRTFQSKVSDDPAFWEWAIVEFEESDALRPPAPGGIVFVGSSSIAFWTDLADDMAPLPVIQRGFGGAHMAHVLHNVHRIVTPYSPGAVVVYAGDNDLAPMTGKGAERVVDEYRSVVDEIHDRLPNACIYFIAIKPSVRRWDRWPEMLRVNRAVEEMSERDPRLGFFDIASPMLGEDGKPRDELFAFDGLHLNLEGYRVWSEVILPGLQESGCFRP